MKINLTKDRRILRIESEEFSIKINGRSNNEYKALFKSLGITLEFQDEKPPVEEVTEISRVTFENGKIHQSAIDPEVFYSDNGERIS